MSNLIVRIVVSAAVPSGDEVETFITKRAQEFGVVITLASGELMMGAEVRAI